MAKRRAVNFPRPNAVIAPQEIAAVAPGMFSALNIDWTSFSPLTAGAGVSITGTWPNQTISSSGVAGGSSGQVQWNNAGAFAGFTFSGDLTLVPSTGVATLATVNGSPGSYGSASQTASATVDAKGRLTALSQQTISIPVADLNNLGTGVSTLLTAAATGSGSPVGSASPTLTGSPGAPTQSPGDNSTKIATDAFVATSYAPLASPTFTGSPAAPTQTPGDNTTKLATDAFVAAALSGVSASPTQWAITGGLPSGMTGSSTTAAMTVSALTATDAADAATIGYVGSKSWAVSNGNAINGYSGGTTLPNSTTIHMYDCHGTSGDGLYAIPHSSYPPSAASCPSGYQSYVRRLFSFMTTGAGAPIPFTAFEKEGGAYRAYLATQTEDIANTTAPTASRTLAALNVPVDIRLAVLTREWGSNSSYTCIFTSPDETDVAPAALNSSSVPLYDYAVGASGQMVADTPLTTNTSGQIGYRCSAANSVYEVTRGFDDWRRS
ncbi:MAG: hypothetical protein E7774_12220 [Bradyrhizobium sp.]|nr:MAG: hypothetical protein E7774_12220 [Bradyrhizobium sp.]